MLLDDAKGQRKAQFVVVMTYVRIPLSLRDVKDLLREQIISEFTTPFPDLVRTFFMTEEVEPIRTHLISIHRLHSREKL